MEPRYRLDIDETNWSVVVTSTGDRFYYDPEVRVSQWECPTDEVAELIRNKYRVSILKLIAKAKGLRIDETKKEKEKRVSGPQKAPPAKKLELKAITKQTEKTVLEPVEKVESKNPSEPIKKTTGKKDENKNESQNLISGYASSDDSGDDESEGDSSELPTSSEEESDSDLEDGENANFLDLELDLDESASGVLEFLSLLLESKLNPFGIWEDELKKIIYDPRFLSVESDKDRQKIFNKWCNTKINEDSLKETSTEELSLEAKLSRALDNFKAFDNTNEDQIKCLKVTPTISYLEFLSKNMKPKKFYLEFKRKHATNPEFHAIELSGQEKEKLYKELMNLKKKSSTEKKELLGLLLLRPEAFEIKELDFNSFLQITEYIENELTTVKVRLALKYFEYLINLSLSVRSNTIYYGFAPKDRLNLLAKHARKEISRRTE